MRRLALAAPAIAFSFALASAAVPAAASTAASTARPRPIHCTAAMSNPGPQDNTTDLLRVRTVSRAHVAAVAHYKTTNHRKTGQAGKNGHLTIRFAISRATPGHRVPVTVTVVRGKRSGSCQTSFVPQRS